MDGERADQPRNGIQVIARAADILRALERHRDGLSLGEIAQLVNLPRSTVQRIVDALDHEGLVIAASPGGGVRLGPALLSLAAATTFQIAAFARPTLEELARQTGETVDLALLNHDKAVFIDQITGTQRLRAVSAVGASFPLHCSANGKAMLAAMTSAELARLRKRLDLPPLTANTITDWDSLGRELDRIRTAGVAFDREEHSIGISAVAAALRAPNGELAAISIPVPTQRFTEIEHTLVERLTKCIDTLRARLAP